MGCKVLDRVNSPGDLKKLDKKELYELASEIREYLIEVVSRCGGHLAPNLGVVELTIGIHLALESPKDKIIFDVGHQSYVHKILTGRKDEFKTLRQFGGISGFPRREESEHDVFNTGHASNSISVALGLAQARDLRGGDETIVAVIGDGALTGGMAFEALNQAGHLKSGLIIVLNDNEMSIAQNVGALSSYLSRVRLDPTYNKIMEDLEETLRKIPGIGEKLVFWGEHFKESVKQFFVPGMLFEELGLKYIGPIDGHDIERVATAVSLAKKIKGPVLIHALTKKGKGFPPAEEGPEKFHGVSPKTKTEEESCPSYPSFTEVFGQSLVELAEKNEKIIGITAAMPSGTGLNFLAQRFPERFFDVGIAEQHAVTFAAGLALQGFIPVVAIYSTFLQRAYDQLIEDVALQNLHVVFALDRSGLVGEDGPTHHGVFDLSFLRAVPNMVVAAPKDGNELRHLLYTAIEHNGPFALRYPRGSGWGRVEFEPFKKLPIGQWEVLHSGERIALLACGRMVKTAIEVSSLLEKDSLTPTVVNARFIKPLDLEMLKNIVKKHELIITLEENVLAGGFGSAVGEALSRFNGLTKLLMYGLPDEFVPHGKIEELFDYIKLTPTIIAEEIKKFIFAENNNEISRNGYSRIKRLLSAAKWLRSR